MSEQRDLEEKGGGSAQVAEAAAPRGRAKKSSQPKPADGEAAAAAPRDPSPREEIEDQRRRAQEGFARARENMERPVGYPVRPHVVGVTPGPGAGPVMPFGLPPGMVMVPMDQAARLGLVSGVQPVPVVPAQAHNAPRPSAAFDVASAIKETEERFDPRQLTKFYVDVERNEANLPEGERDDSDYVGFLGRVEDTADYLDVIARRFGGGEFVIKGVVNGKAYERKVRVPGESKKVIGGKEVVEDDDEEDVFPMPSQRRVWPTGGAVAPAPVWNPPPAQGQPGAWPQTPPWGGPLGSPVYPRPGSAPYPAAAPQELEAMRKEMERLREEAAAAREAAAAEREERRVEAERAKAEALLVRIEQSERTMNDKLDMLVTKLQAQNGGGGGSSAMDKMIELMTLQMQAEAQKRDAERDREAERMRREEKERRDQYEREDKRRQEQAAAEHARILQQNTEQREFWNRMIEFGQKDKQKPKDFIELLAALQQLNPKRDATDETLKMVTTFTKLQEVIGGGKERSSAEEIVDKITDGVTTIAEKWLETRPPQAQVDPTALYAAQQAAANERLQLAAGPGRMTHDQMMAIAAYRHQQAEIAERMRRSPVDMQRVAAEADRAPTEDEWGMILQHVLTAYTNDDRADPATYVPELHAYVVADLRVPKALSILESASVSILRLKIGKIKDGIKDAEIATKALMFEQYILNDEEGAEWLDGMFRALREHQAAVRATASHPSVVDRKQQQPGLAPGFRHVVGPDGQRYVMGPDGRAYAYRQPDPAVAAVQSQVASWRPNAAVRDAEVEVEADGEADGEEDGEADGSQGH